MGEERPLFQSFQWIELMAVSGGGACFFLKAMERENDFQCGCGWVKIVEPVEMRVEMRG